MIFSSFLASTEKSLIEELWEYFAEKYLTPQYGYYQNITVDRNPLVSPAAIFLAIFFAIMAACVITIFNRRTLGRPVRYLLKHDAVGKENAKTFDELGLKKTWIIRLFINRLTLSKAIRCVEEDEFYGIGKDTTEPENAQPSESSGSDLCRSDCERVYEEEKKKDKKLLRKEKREEKNRLSNEKIQEISSRSKNAHYIAAASKAKYKRKIDTDRFYIEDGMQYRAKVRFSLKGTNPMLLLAVAVGYIIIGVLFIKFLPDMLAFADSALSNFK